MLRIQIQDLATEITEWIPSVNEIVFGYSGVRPGYWFDGAFMDSARYRILAVKVA